jgi:CheY-like chemotaxis protein
MILDQPRGDRRAGAYVRLRVSDDGMGMPPEVAARVTEPFFTTKGVGKGTGLGLSMVQGLTAQSGGWMEIDSEVEQGTRIDLWLPLAAPGLTGSGPTVNEEVQDTGPRLVVLAVDDDPLVLTNTVAMLDELGHRVLVANSGDEALVIFHRHPEIELVLTDEVMPGLSGSQLADRVKQISPGTAVALVSGYVDLHPTPSPSVNCLPRLAKPFTLAQLASFLDDQVLKAEVAVD